MKKLSLTILATTLLQAAPAMADFKNNDTLFDFADKERWIFRTRMLMVEPDESANISAIGGTVDIDEQYVPEIDFTYFFTENVAAELIAAVTPHDVTAQGTALGQVDLGKVWLLPPTLTLQYHFMPDSETFRPYVGAGLNYTHFFNADKGAVNSIEYDDSFGAAFQVGADYGITENVAVNFDVKKIMINPDVTINGGAINADVDIDPWVIGVGLAYRF